MTTRGLLGLVLLGLAVLCLGLGRLIYMVRCRPVGRWCPLTEYACGSSRCWKHHRNCAGYPEDRGCWHDSADCERHAASGKDTYNP